MDLGNHLCIAGITDLPPELAQPICKYLDAVDVVNICTAIPSWRWILSLQTPHSYSNRWRWVDKQVCTTLCSGSHTVDFEKFREATMQHFEQMRFDLHFPSIKAPRGTFEGVNCLMIKPIRIFPIYLLSGLPIEEDWTRFLQDSRTLRVKVMNVNRHTTVNIKAIHHSELDRRSRLSRHSGLFSTADHESGGREEERRQVLAAYDCVLLIITHSILLGSGSMIRDELQAIVPNISPDQTLRIVILENVIWEEQSGIGFFMECLRKLNSAGDFTLMSVPVNWRMWCAKVDENHITDRSDIFEWLCQDVIWRRMQAPQLQLAAGPSKVLDFPDWFT